jgi:hypothetical protein
VSAATRNCRETARVKWAVRPCRLLPHRGSFSPASVCFALLRRAFFRIVVCLPRSDLALLGLRRCRPRSRPRTHRTCQHGQTCFAPAPRGARRQRHGAKPACRQASQAARQRRGHHTPHNRDACRDPAHGERVRPWRQAHPGDGRRQRARAPQAFHEDLTPQETHKQPLDDGLRPPAFHAVCCMPPAV